MNDVYDDNAWSLYWSENRLHSCVASSSDEDQKVLNSLWQSLAESLPSQSKILDLATGNGAVVNALIAANKTLEIDAIDKATIAPRETLSKHEFNENVRFHANIDVLNMPFENGSFDCITSQFGIEYAGLKRGSESSIVFLKTGGTLKFIVHNASSAIIMSSKNKITELEQLCKEGGVLDILIEVMAGKENFEKLESAGQYHLQNARLKSEAITGQVFSGVETIINNWASKPKESLELGVAMDMRVRSELARLQQLIQAGQTSEQMDEWLVFMNSLGVECHYTPLYLNPNNQDYLLAWSVTGVRTK